MCCSMPRLRNALILFSLLLAVGCTEGRAPQLQSWKDATGAEAYERSFWRAIEDGDVASAEHRLAPILTLTTNAGVAGRDKAVEYFRALHLKHIDIADLRVDPEGADMIVSYVATLETNSSSSATRYFMTTVWQQTKSGWIAICHTEVPSN